MQRLRPARSRAGALDRIVRALSADLGRHSDPPPAAHLAALHAGAPAEAESLLQRAAVVSEPVTAYVAEFSTAMVVQTGRGLVGLAWWCEGTPLSGAGPSSADQPAGRPG